MATPCYFFAVAFFFLSGLPLTLLGQHVMTRILPTEQIILQGHDDLELQGEGQTAVVWCLVQDLDPGHQIMSLELSFKVAPQVKTGLDKEEDLFRGSFFNQMGVPGSDQQTGKDAHTSSQSELAQILRGLRPRPAIPDGFPEAQMTNSNTSSSRQQGQFPAETDSTNKSLTYKLNAEDPSSRLDNQCLLPGCVTVARVLGSGSAQLGVQHVQRSGVTVRGVISANPNLSSLQVTIQRATCSDCGTYTCMLRYQTSDGIITETKSTNDLIVAQSITHRLNMNIKGGPSSPKPTESPLSTTDFQSADSTIPPSSTIFALPPVTSQSASSTTTSASSTSSTLSSSSSSSSTSWSIEQPNDEQESSPKIQSSLSPRSTTPTTTAVAITDLICFGTVSNPSVPFVWSRRRHPSRDFNVTSRAKPAMMLHGEPQMGRNCQYWRTSALRHVWDASDDAWIMFGCFLTPDHALIASALISVEGPLVTASCGDPHSTLPLNKDDHVTVVCDVSSRVNVTATSFKHAGSEQARCFSTKDDVTELVTWNCVTSGQRYSARKDGTRFVLTIDLYDVSSDQGQWECLVTPLDADFAALCVLG